MVKGYVGALVERLGHADGNVRDGVSEALGVLMKVLGEPIVTKLMPDVDAIKLAKVKEFMEKVGQTCETAPVTDFFEAQKIGNPCSLKPPKIMKNVKKYCILTPLFFSGRVDW